MNFITVLFTI
ncbi:MAG: hypothetical protein JW915_22410 [Chitinispirillaceae bacterium]|nr:hypothetical protein [Chitinispirillaceae bacterium]